MSADRLLVPVANPETADRLLDTATDVATDRDLEILVLSVFTVPMQVPLGEARRRFDVDDRENLVNEAVERAQGYGVAARGRIQFSRNVAESIRSVADAEDVTTILLGWRGRPRRRDVVLGSHIDDVLGDAPCDVLVKRIDRDRRAVSSVLVPVAGGPNTEFAAETARRRPSPRPGSCSTTRRPRWGPSSPSSKPSSRDRSSRRSSSARAITT